MPTPRSRTEISAARLQKLRGMEESAEPLTDETLAVLAFLQIHHTADLVIKAVERDLAAHGLSVVRYAILRMLAGREPMPLSWLAARHFSRRSNITAVVDRLCRDNFLERLPDPEDGRVVRVAVTPAGLAAANAARKPHLDFLTRTLAPLTPDEQRHLIELLDKLSAPLDGGADPLLDSL